MTTKKPLYCSFCGKPKAAVSYLIAGDFAMICEPCVRECVVLIKQQISLRRWRLVRSLGQKLWLQVTRRKPDNLTDDTQLVKEN